MHLTCLLVIVLKIKKKTTTKKTLFDETMYIGIM
jgi:hypothetical protein